MKRISILFIVVISLYSCASSNNGAVTVTVDVKNTPAQKVYLMNVNGKNKPDYLDSLNYTGTGAFTLKAKVLENSFLQIVYSKDAQQGKFLPIVTNGETITIIGDYADLKKVIVSGSKATNDLTTFLAKVDEERKSENAIALAIDTIKPVKNNDSTIAAKQTELMAIATKNYETKLDFARKTDNPVLAIIAFQTMASMQDLVKSKPQMDSLKTKFSKSTFFNNSYDSYLNIINPGQTQANSKKSTEDGATATRSVAKEISLPDVNGKTITLSSFKGKYVLVDFWASWCGPCRGENPNVVAAYNKYKNKNFTILGVSLDKDKASWTKAIADDDLAWTQVSDLKFWQCQAARDYGIESIPANFLIDPAGVIVASNLRGSDLEDKLAEVLK
jgi:peroxiredoxin